MENEFEYTQPKEAAPMPQQPPKKQTKRTGGAGIIALALCFSLIGGILGGGGVYWFMTQYVKDAEPAPNTTVPTVQQEKEDPKENTPAPPVTTPPGGTSTAAQIYTQNVNSTVGITTSVTTNFWGYQTTSAASGSGFIYNKDGYILTNHHVIENSNAITVSMYDGTTYDATVVGYDASNDIAVLKIEAENLIPVTIGDSEQLQVGDDVVAIGNPLGELTFSLTKGVVSAKDRRVTLSSGSTMNLIQTDCTINSGNSGGALFNIHGQVIGITNAKYSNNGNSSEASIESIGFAIPINHILSIVNSIIEKGYVEKPYIGLSVTDVGAEAQNYGLPKGAAVSSVSPDSPAEDAGLQQNDIITAVNGNAIESADDLVALVADANPNDVLELTVYRQGQTLQLTITVGEQIQDAVPQKNN